jgi:hypothetical protein
MTLAPRTWKMIALLAAVFCVAWFACGLLVNAIPTRRTGTPEDIRTGFEITRACCFAPSMAGLFLAYLAFLAGRRGSGRIEAYELVAGLGAALGLALTILGLAVIAEPTRSEPLAVRAAFGGLFVVPGFVLIFVAGLGWRWMRGRR